MITVPVIHIDHPGLFVGRAPRRSCARGGEIGLLHASLRVVTTLVVHINMVGLLVCGTPNGRTVRKAEAWTALAAAGVVAPAAAVFVGHIDHARIPVSGAP